MMAGVDRELIDVDLGEDRVEVHEGARDRDVEGQDALDLGVGVPEDVLGHDVDRGGWCAGRCRRRGSSR